MATILLFTVLGFLTGFVYIIVKRKIRISNILSATFITLLSAAVLKIIKKKYKRRIF